MFPLALYLPAFTSNSTYIFTGDPETLKLLSIDANTSEEQYPTQALCSMKPESLRDTLLNFFIGGIILTVVISGLTYIVLIVAMIIRGIRHSQNNLAVELKLAAVFLINVSLLTGILTFATVSSSLNHSLLSFYLFDFVYFFMDVYLLSNPYLLIIFSNPVRIAIWNFWKIGRGNVVQNVALGTNTRNWLVFVCPFAKAFLWLIAEMW